MPAEVEVGVSALVNRDCQGERLRPELVFTDRAPEVIVRPVPVMSVMAASAETFRESVTVVVALSEPVMRRLASMVEDAWTKMPAVVEVGVRAAPPKILCQAPLASAPSSLPQASTPAAEVSMLLQDTSPSTVSAPPKMPTAPL